MNRLVLAATLPLVAIVALLQGCNKPTECPETTTTVVQETVSVGPMGDESYGCTNIQRAGAAQQTWCEARAQFEQSEFSSREDSFKSFLKGYRDGLNDARQAKDSRVSRDAEEGKQWTAEEAGYHAGYSAVLKTLGVIEYDCASDDQASEYKDRWCEGFDSFRTSGIGGNNPFIKGRYIDGHMHGGRVALTVPTSMESFFNGENPEGKQPDIVQPEREQNATEQSFHRGFDEGYKAMIASIRESINQVMEQMQMPNNMELPEGMMPPQQPGGSQ